MGKLFTDEQCQLARDTDMIDLLSRYEGFQFKMVGHVYKCIEHDSLVIREDRKHWYWNSRKVGGTNAIDYLQTIDKCDYKEAMQILIGDPNVSFTHKKSYNLEEIEDKEFIMPEKLQGQYNRVFAYLTRCRCIDAAVVLQCFDDKKLYQDVRNNAVFVGYNQDGEAKFACIRGTLSDVQYRGDCTGSDKSCPFVLEGSYKKKIFVFESPIDAMSHATLTNLAAKNHTAWAKHTRLSLSCSADTALLGYLKYHDEIEEIVFCLDNDDAGKKNTDDYLKKYSEKGYKVSATRPNIGKDYNEFLQTYTKAIKEKIIDGKQAVNTKSVSKGR